MKKISKIKQLIIEEILLIVNFGFKIGLLDIIRKFIFRKQNKLGKYFEYLKHETIKKYLFNQYKDIILNPSYQLNQLDTINEEKISTSSIIWIFWWQGIDKSSDIVNKCIKSIHANARDHQIIIVDQYNFQNYADIPDYIMTKFNQKKITITHFSDILRMELLYKHGGIWMDATLFLSDSLPSDIYTRSFYTIKHGQRSDYHVCKGLWSGFFLASNKENLAIKYFRDMFYQYWRREDSLICYLLIDCIIALGYENNPYIKATINNVPYNNCRIFDLSNVLNSPYSESIYSSIKKSNSIHKLTYKKKLITTNRNSITFYGKMIEELL